MSNLPIQVNNPIARYVEWGSSIIPKKFSNKLAKQRLSLGFDYQLKFVNGFRRKNVLLLAGTDAPTLPGLVPDILFTLKCSYFIKPGKDATLVLLDKNPFKAITNTLAINKVIFKGMVISEKRKSYHSKP